ncbi:zinc finger protein ZFP2 [Drosophila tropicalis]|uniref:zinc finger protein ZFP2 n=1 Tax=Drosophila tropicalis TaxID=46794 RepID=UPI0035AB99B0
MCSTTTVLCPLCAVPSFGSIDALQQRLIKAANGPLACPFPNCKEMFLGLDKLTIHLFTHTTLMAESASPVGVNTSAKRGRSKRSKVKPAEPVAPPAVVAVEPVQIPPAPPTPAPPVPPPARCDICEFSFRNNDLRDMHFRLVHENAEEQIKLGQEQEPYKCHLCAKTFRMKGSLRVHLKVVHMMGMSSFSIHTGSSSPSTTHPSPKISICDRIRHKEAAASGNVSSASTSTQPYALSGALCMLQQTPAPHQTSLLAADSSPEPLAGGVVTPKVWECDVCTKSFTTKYFLKKHKRLHTGEMPYTCEICARTFTFQQSYHKHLLYHSEVKPHVCSVCGRAFKELSTLHNHQRIHSGEKPFKCEVCGKCFRQRVSFLVHTRIHTGVMPYKCELCQKTFRYKVSQRTHKCLTEGEAALQQQPQPQPQHELLPQQTPEQLIKALLENNESQQSQQSPASAEIASITSGAHEEALLSQSIDDIVVEQCQKLGICGLEPQLPPAPVPVPVQVPLDAAGLPQFNGGGSSSPLQQLQNLRLYSPQHVEMPSSGSDGEIFGRFLMDAS